MSAKASSSNRHQSNQNLEKAKAIWYHIKTEVNESINCHHVNVDELTMHDLEEREIYNTSPTMVFSVIGDSDSFVPRPWPTTVFQTALIEAAKSGGETWIIYRGYDDGLSKIVKDAYQNYEDMEFETKEPNKRTVRNVKCISVKKKKTASDIDKVQRHKKIEKQQVGQGSTNEDISMAFEKFVSTQKVSFFSQQMDIRMPVPIAIIVCEGDLNTIAEIKQALEHNLPVIIMKGSGKAADLVLDYIDKPEDLRKNASTLLGIRFNKKDYETLKNRLLYISENTNLIGRFDLDRDDPLMLSNIIGQAVVSCWSMNENDERNMEGSTIAPNISRKERIDLRLLEGYKKEFRPYVLNPKYSCPTSLPLYFYFGYQLLQETEQMKECGPILLLEALKANRCDYVRVLLDRGVQLNVMNLSDLYKKTVACEGCNKQQACLHMQWILTQIHKTYAEEIFDDKKAQNNCSQAEAPMKLCCEILRYKRLKEKDEKSAKAKRKQKTRVASSTNQKTSPEYANVSDLLLWSIFANRKELAEICWLRGNNHLLTGLVCSAILKKLSKKAGNVKEQVLSNDLENHSKLFEQRCIKMMDRMYEENTKSAIDLMDTEANIWGIHSSPLTFAYENFMYDVVAHTCSQKNMNRQWYNNLAPDPFLASAFTKPKQFVTAPLTKYIFNYMLFFTMLFMYSAFVLTSISTKYYVQDTARIFEYYVYFWGAGDFIEELISCFGCLEDIGRSHRSYYYRMKRYLYDFWNVVDLLSYILLIAALFVRHFYIDESFTIARRMFALSLLVMYLRFLEVFLIHRKLGPTLIMIKEMLKDLLRFLFIAVFVVLGVGIYYHANLWPDHQTIWSGDWTNWRIWTIIYYPYWQLYAELNLEHLDGSDQSEETNCTNVESLWESDTSINRCPQEDWTVQAIAAIYLLFSNLLLVNLVIAMFSFSYTFERVQENSEKLWRFERYTVINDYDWRIPSPINLVFLPYRFFGCLHQCRKSCHEKRSVDTDNEEGRYLVFQRKFQRISALKNHNKI